MLFGKVGKEIGMHYSVIAKSVCYGWFKIYKLWKQFIYKKYGFTVLFNVELLSYDIHISTQDNFY